MGSARCITSLQHKAIFVLHTHAMLWTIASSSLRVTWFSLTPSDGKKYLISLQNHITIVKVYCKKDHQCVKSRSSATDKSLSSENVRNSKNDMIYSKVALQFLKRPLMALLILPFPLLTIFSQFSNFPFQFSLHLLPFPIITAKK